MFKISRTHLDQALYYSGAEDEIVILRDNELVYRKVKIGVKGDNYVEIVGSEIQEGDRVIIGVNKEKQDRGTRKTSPLQMKFREKK